MHLNQPWDLTVVLSTSSCNEAISLSPTGFQLFRTFSASLKSASRSSMEHCRSFSFSSACSICFCQPLAQVFRLSHFSFTSADCLRIALAIFCAFSSGVNSENGGKKCSVEWIGINRMWTRNFATFKIHLLPRIIKYGLPFPSVVRGAFRGDPN